MQRQIARCRLGAWWCLVLGGFWLSGCAGRQPPAERFATSPGTLEEIRNDTTSLRVVLRAKLAEANDDEVKVVIVLQEPAHLVADFLDPLGNTALRIIRSPEGTIISNPRELDTREVPLEMVTSIPVATLLEVLAGLPPRDHDGEGSSVIFSKIDGKGNSWKSAAWTASRQHPTWRGTIAAVYRSWKHERGFRYPLAFQANVLSPGATTRTVIDVRVLRFERNPRLKDGFFEQFGQPR